MDFTLVNLELENKIMAIERSSQTRIQIYSQIIVLCRETLESFRHQIVQKKFKTSADEIAFFKLHKQVPLSQLIFYVHLRELKAGLPVAGDPRKFYVERKIEEVGSFFMSNKDFVQYVDLDQEQLDEYYFTRKFNLNDKFTGYGCYYEDPDFTTSKDILLGELKAYRKLMPFLQKQLPGSALSSNNLGEETQGLQWTASKVALIELIYALHSSGSLNNGALELNTLTSFFENSFNIKLDNFYKTYNEIKARKGSKTKFLEELTYNLQQRINRDDAL